MLKSREREGWRERGSREETGQRGRGREGGKEREKTLSLVRNVGRIFPL